MFNNTAPEHDLFILKKNPEPLAEFVCNTNKMNLEIMNEVGRDSNVWS